MTLETQDKPNYGTDLYELIEQETQKKSYRTRNNTRKEMVCRGRMIM